MTVERTFDMSEIRRIVTSEEVYKYVTDDGSPTRDKFVPIESDAVIYLAVLQNKRIDGIFMFAPQNAACVEVHTCLTRPLWGRGGDAAKLAAGWIWDNTHFQRIITNVPVYNRLAMKLSLCAGMKAFGVNPDSFMKNGNLHDQVMLGMNRGMPCL